MSETTEFPLPADVTDDERAAAKREIGKYTTIVGEDARTVRFEGRALGQTGPIWHFQYTRMYAIPKGFLVAAHDLREGIVVGFADEVTKLPECFEHAGVREFIEDELRFRKVITGERAAAQ